MQYYLNKYNPFILPCSINRDKKGYNKGDGALIVGAFFRKHARESALAKLSLGTFPTIPIAPQNVNRVAADLFVRAARQHFHHEILKCFDEFNRAGGRTVQLQNGLRMQFSKSIISAIYADYPAARNCTVTISACPQCFTRQRDMALPPPQSGFYLRTPKSIAATRRTVLRDARTDTVKAAKLIWEYAEILRQAGRSHKTTTVLHLLDLIRIKTMNIKMYRKLCSTEWMRV